MPTHPHYKATRRRIYELLAQARPDDPLSRIVDLVIMSMILLSAVAITPQSMESLRLRPQQYLSKVDTALEDGIVSIAEKRELEALHKALGISSESAERILATQFAMITRASDASDYVCPYCNHVSEQPSDGSMTCDVLPLRRTALQDSS